MQIFIRVDSTFIRFDIDLDFDYKIYDIELPFICIGFGSGVRRES
jgi:hypothetical protein